ncbi:ABC transporter ATP-binding protein [Streptomyces sp. 6N223]|uniref:ABC transporter ATP-binding protein n=1 Tax=Streptomyces sp. 6N223 TaxID=3457412 RepID=UPI003FD5B0EE
MIEIKGVTKTFTGREGNVIQALQGVDLTVADNEFLTILGPSGCGKTTLLRAIAGLVDADAGEITVDGEPVRRPGPDRAMVFQNFALLPWATVLDNVAFGLELRGESKAARRAKARELTELVGLAGFESQLPGELSGGMQQRVGLARALAVEPNVLLMDEPFGALDEQTRRILQEELLAIWERRRLTVVFITHSMEEAVLLGDRVVLMSPRPGRIAEIVPVDIPRPRASDVGGLERSPAFTAITSRLWESLRAMHPDHRTTARASEVAG